MARAPLAEPVELVAADGYPLSATLYRAAGEAARAVTIQSATGVPQEYYGKFAEFLAARGFAVLTFDYRGIGRSLRGRLRKQRATMRDWGTLDAPAALEYLERAAPGARLMAVGHSFGGQALGLLPQRERLAAALVVGSQSGWWRNWRALGRAWMWPAVHVGLPLVPRLLGYFPGARLGFGEDLPAGVAIEWASWCRNPEYLVGALGVHAEYARFRAPLRAYAIADDAFAPRRAVEALLALYPNSPGEVRAVEPRELGERAIGHFGFFRERFRASLWTEAAEWLARH